MLGMLDQGAFWKVYKVECYSRQLVAIRTVVYKVTRTEDVCMYVRTCASVCQTRIAFYHFTCRKRARSSPPTQRVGHVRPAMSWPPQRVLTPKAWRRWTRKWPVRRLHTYIRDE